MITKEEFDKRLVELESVIVEFTLFYSELTPLSDAIWDAFNRNDPKDVLSYLDLFLLNIPERAWRNKLENGLVDLVEFSKIPEIDKQFLFGKKKVTSSSDLLKESKRTVKEETKITSLDEI